LYEFTGGSDGAASTGGVVIGPNGALYGTTNGGGVNYGTVFELRPSPAVCKAMLCYWNETVQHTFTGPPDGKYPAFENLTFDQARDIYGTTEAGGLYGGGTTFELTPSGGGYIESILHSFGSGTDGQSPYSGVVLDTTITTGYVDHGVSGSKESRPQLNQLMTDAYRRNFDAVLVWKIDRFGCSLKHLVNALAGLGAYGAAFVSFRDNLDLSTPSGRLMFQIIGAMAEFERSFIQERVKAGLRNARAKGKGFGRPRVEIDAVRVAELRRDGLSWSQVCRTLNVSKGSAQRSVATIA